MEYITRTIGSTKNIALVAHDHYKKLLLDWCNIYKDKLKKHNLYATGTTGNLIKQQINLDVTSLLSGPMGGDQQLGSYIAESKIDLLIFFWDPLNSVPHDPDVKALLRIATVWNVPIAMNISTANILLESDFLPNKYKVQIPDYLAYMNKRIEE